ncbi:MAG: hypothetical protein NZL87_04980, partial [Thermomicrobium sp.]|nr:hypothetical protein [Thermomicrobium sp.]
MNGILVVVETAAGAPRAAALELFGAVRPLRATLGPVTALVVGDGIARVAEQVAALGAERVLLVDQPEFAQPVAARMQRAVLRACERVDPALVLLPGTTLGRDVAALVAARRGVPHLVDIVELGVDGDELLATRPVYQSALLTT